MVYRGQVRGGVVVLDEPATLPEGTVVRVELIGEPAVGQPAHRPTILERLGPVVGAAQGLPEDAARNVDQYLYGSRES